MFHDMNYSAMNFLKVGGGTLLATGSFLLGSQYGKESNFFRNAEADATALTTLPYMSTVPLNDQKDVGVSRASQIMQYGYPGFDNLRSFDDFVLSYDRKTRTAHWVCEHLTPESFPNDSKVDRALCQFRPDPSLHKYFQSLNDDYKGSGYDRGHLAAAGNHRKSQSAIDQTFFLTNMSPQVGKGFNRDKWNDLEKYARKIVKKNLNTYILTGPLYLPRKESDGHLYVKYKLIGKNHVAVPTHFFKVLLFETSVGQFELECYVLPNEVIPDEVPLTSFLVPLELIERNGGFLVFDKVPKKAIKKINGKKA